MGKWQYQALRRSVVKTRSNSHSYIGVGLSDKNAPLSRLPGWDKCSYGYHADDGKAFCGASNAGEDYGPTFTTGDVIGCGLDFVDKTIFYTKNGIHLGRCCVGVCCGCGCGCSVCPSIWLALCLCMFHGITTNLYYCTSLSCLSLQELRLRMYP